MSTPPPPKRAMNATFRYIQEKRADFVKKYPTKKVTEVTTELSAEYSALSEADKKKYVDAYNKDKERYEKVNSY